MGRTCGWHLGIWKAQVSKGHRLLGTAMKMLSCSTRNPTFCPERFLSQLPLLPVQTYKWKSQVRVKSCSYSLGVQREVKGRRSLSKRHHRASVWLYRLEACITFRPVAEQDPLEQKGLADWGWPGTPGNAGLVRAGSVG